MAVNFTPDMKPYSGQGKFRYWVQMVLPTIYDDSLSYMELLNKVVYVINLAIEDVGAVEENVAALLEAFNELQQYTNDYFDNLDVQEEINNKLDEMVEDGTFSEILYPLISSFQNELDLLKDRVDNLTETITPGTTTGDAEIIDVRVGNNGITYPNAGDSVRGQFEQLASVSDKDIITNKNEGYSTVSIDIGEVVQNTIITKNTGVTRSGGNNNFATKNYIKVPKTKFYVVSKLSGFYVATYGYNFRFIEDIYTEDNIHNWGILEIDNSNGIYEYIKIGFYVASGYSPEKFNACEVICYTNNELNNNFISSQNLGPYSLNTTETVSVVYSDVRTGPIKFKKANSDIQIIKEANTTHNWRILLAVCKDITNDGYGVDIVFSNWNTTSNVDQAITIPKGSYYWLGYCEGDNIKTVSEVIEESKKHIHITEFNNEPTYYQFGTTDFSATNLSRVGLIEKIYADKDIYLISNDTNIVFSVRLYDDNEWYTPSKRGIYSVSKYYIPKGTWFRYNVGYSDNSTIQPEDIKTVYNKVGVYENWNNNEAINNEIYGLQGDLSDLRRRVFELENNNVPTYYIQHISNKVNTINELNNNKQNEQFTFITDTHINGYGGNTMHAKPLINYIFQNTLVRKLFNGGDLFKPGTGLTPPETLDLLQKSLIYTQPDYCDGVQFYIMGNHDLGDDWVDDVHYPASITAQELYDNCGNNSKSGIIKFDTKSQAGFYFDSNGIRYIISNFGIDTYTNESIGDTFLFIGKAIENVDTPIIILQHVLWNTPIEDPSFRPYRLQQLQNIVDAYNTRSTVQYGTGSDYLFDYSNAKGRVCAIIGGHLHEDRYSYTPEGVPIIATTTDCWGGEYNIEQSGRTNAAGTINEQAFDVFTLDLEENKLYATRIGYGDDREFTIPTVE